MCFFFFSCDCTFRGWSSQLPDPAIACIQTQTKKRKSKIAKYDKLPNPYQNVSLAIYWLNNQNENENAMMVNRVHTVQCTFYRDLSCFCTVLRTYGIRSVPKIRSTHIHIKIHPVQYFWNSIILPDWFRSTQDFPQPIVVEQRVSKSLYLPGSHSRPLRFSRLHPVWPPLTPPTPYTVVSSFLDIATEADRFRLWHTKLNMPGRLDGRQVQSRGLLVTFSTEHLTSKRNTFE